MTTEFYLTGDTNKNSHRYILESKLIKMHMNLYIKPTEKIASFLIPNGLENKNQFLAMIYIYSDFPPFNVEMKADGIIIASCDNSEYIHRVNDSEKYSEFTSILNSINYKKRDGKIFSKKEEELFGENCYKILLYRDTIGINMRPNDINTNSYFFPINTIKCMDIRLEVHFRDAKDIINCELLYANKVPYKIYTEINGKKATVNFAGGVISFPVYDDNLQK